MKKIKWLGIGTSSALSVGVVATAAIIQATTSGVVAFNPSTLSAIEDVVENQEISDAYTIGEINLPDFANTSKKGKPNSSSNDDGVISSEDDLSGSGDDVVSPVSAASVVSPVEDESVVSVVTVVSEVSPVSPVSVVSPVSPISGTSPASPVSND